MLLDDMRKLYAERLASDPAERFAMDKHGNTDGSCSTCDADANAAWLSQAHAMCFDLGIAPGHIEERMFQALGRVRLLQQVEQAAQNLCNVKGRHHSEIAMRQLIEACGMMGPNVRSEGVPASSALPSTDGLCGNGSEVGAGGTASE